MVRFFVKLTVVDEHPSFLPHAVHPKRKTGGASAGRTKLLCKPRRIENWTNKEQEVLLDAGEGERVTVGGNRRRDEVAGTLNAASQKRAVHAESREPERA